MIFFTEAREGRLSFQVCDDCGTRIAYPHVVCPNCLSDRLSRQASVGRGTVYSFTTLHRAGNPAMGSRVPYTIVLVELDEGVRVLADLADDAGEPVPRIGMSVEVFFEELTDELSIPRFRAVEGASA
jgi:hypothetical protein